MTRKRCQSSRFHLADPAAPSVAAALAALAALATITTSGAARAQAPGTPQLQGQPQLDDGPPEARVGQLRAMSLEDLLNLTTATGSGGEVEERATAAANIVFISRAEILQNGWQSVGEALATVPGLYLIDAGTGPSIGVRGVTGGLRAGTRLVKVMINGVAVNFRPDLRAFLGPEYLPIAAVERIEVAMGPLSSLYGANAFIATVNVITRISPPGTQVEASVAGQHMDGGHVGWRSSGLASYGGANVSVLLAASTAGLDRSGRWVRPTFDAQMDPNDPGAIDPRFDPYFGRVSQGDNAYPTGAFGQLKIWKTPVGGVTLEGGVQRLDANGEFELNSTLTHDSRESLVNGWLAGKLDTRWSEVFSTNLTAGVSGGEPTRDDRQYLTSSRARAFERNFGYRALNASLTSLLSFERLLTVRLGLDAEFDQEDVLYYTAQFNQAEGARQAGQRLDLIDAGKPKQQLLSDLGADLQVSGSPLRNLRITASGRLDRVSYGDFGPPLQYSWRLAVAQRFAQGLYAKLIAGRAFQAPSGVLMFAEPGFGAANNIIGNLNATGIPGLRPQTVESAELVVYGLVAARAVLEGSVYYQVLKDKIEFRSGGTDYVARNGGQTEYVGAEAAAHFDFGPVKPFLTGAAVSRLVDNKLLLTPPPAYPNVMGTAGLDIDLFAQRLHLNGRVRVVGRRGATESNVLYNFDRRYSLPPYATVDATVSTGGLRLIGDNAETRFIVSASDLLDEARSEPAFGGYDVPTLGRRVLAELRQSF